MLNLLFLFQDSCAIAPAGVAPELCVQAKLDSIDCGVFGITQEQCLAKGCCFGPNLVLKNLPSCFFVPKDVVPVNGITDPEGKVVNVNAGVIQDIPDMIPEIKEPNLPPGISNSAENRKWLALTLVFLFM